MTYTDLFIRRPVLATVVSLLILLLGLQAIFKLQVRQYPKLSNTQITVTTQYPGASAELMQGFITNPLEQAISSAEGVDYVSSTSTQGQSQISVYLKLDADPDVAMTDVMAKVAEKKNELPQEAFDPVIKKTTGDSSSIFYLSFNSPVMSLEQITEYLTRVVQPKLQSVSGVAQAQILGGRQFAMRIWLDPHKMAALGITPGDVAAVLRANNYQSAAGQTEGPMVVYNVKADTNLESVLEFENMVVKSDGETLVRLKNIAHIALGPQSSNSSMNVNGQNAVTFGITALPSANPLEVISQIRALLPEINRQLPPSLHSIIMYDATAYIRASIYEVVITLLEAAGIVVVVIFLFLGALRSVAIPVVTIPLSLVGVMFMLLAMGFSINLLTLLALVLAIGLVVDDAIVVVENIHRHIEEGKRPYEAALEGAREIASPVITMTLTLAAVYAPIGFMGGLTGALFKEFAFTLAGAVIVSGVVALTLSPMMSSRILSDLSHEGRLAKWLDDRFQGLKGLYERRLHSVLEYRAVTLVMVLAILGSLYFLFVMTPAMLAPAEDQGVIFMAATGPKYANLDYMERYTRQYETIAKSVPETRAFFNVNGFGGENKGFAGLILKPWDQRTRTQAQIIPEVQQAVAKNPGLQIAAFPRNSLPGSGGMPVQFVITTPADNRTLYTVMKELETAARRSGLFIVLRSSLSFDNPEVRLHIDRAKAAQLGLSMQEIGQSLSVMLGEGYVNRFSREGYSYQVIPQLPRRLREDPDLIRQIQVRTRDGVMVPLSSVVTMEMGTQPNELRRFNQINSASIEGVMMPGKSLGEVLDFLRQKADEIFPRGFEYDYLGESRQFIQEGSSLTYAFGFSMIIIYLLLAAQFESFRDPFIILVSVPMSIFGALVPLTLGLGTINIYTQIGLVTLIGLISKHGILIVQFANQLQRQGMPKAEAIREAAGTRLRPILMTTAAMVVAMIPLLTANGAGAASRFAIGLVIASGMTIGTMFTLFVVPVIYSYLGQVHHRDEGEGPV